MSRLILNPHRFASAAPPPASGIQFVGRSVNAHGGLGNSPKPAVVDLTNLVGGIGTAPQPGDIVIAYCAGASNADRNIQVGTTGYTLINYRRLNSSLDATFDLEWKAMGATPDTTVEFYWSSNTSVSRFYFIAEVWRGVNNTTPIDAGPELNGTTSSVIVDIPAITPVTAGAAVLGFAAGAHDQTTGPTYSSSGWDSTASEGFTSGSHVATYFIGHKLNVSSTFTPGSLSFSGTDSTAYSCAVASIALRPA